MSSKRLEAKLATKKVAAKPKSRVAKNRAATAPASAKAMSGGGRVASSLASLLETLAMDAYTKAEKSGERERYETDGGDADELYGELWENEYRWVFFSAFFDLSTDLRGDAAVRKVAKRAVDVFTRKLSDERACFAYCKKHWKTPDRVGLLSFFDGSAVRPLRVDDFASVRKKLVKEAL